MRPGSVVIVNIALHDPAKLLFAGDDDVVETFSPDRTDHPFGIPVLPGRSSSNRPVSNAHGTQSVFKGLAVDAVPIPDQIPRRLVPRKCLRDLAAKPRCGRMSRDAEREQLPAIMAKDNQAIEQLEADRRNHENVDRRNGRGVISQEGLPRLRRWPAASGHVIGDGRLRDLDAKLEQLAMDPRSTPE